MAEQLERFKELYISLVIEQGLAMDDEMLALFEELLAGEFDDNPELMSAYIQSIIDEQTPPEPSELELLQQENKELKTRIEKMAAQQELTDGAVMDLATMLLTR